MSHNTKVFVGMSGGVDSSLTAALLVEQGYDVTGVYMKNWSQDLPGMKCPWAEDLADAKRVAVQIGIDFRVFDFEKEYKHKVVDHMIEEYKRGRTPNPDIMCNQEVKFKLFFETALEQGADMIATGHYARVQHSDTQSRFSQIESSKTASRPTLPEYASGPEGVADVLEDPSVNAQLAVAKDTNKDQTYFLYRISAKALEKTLFPLGKLTKPEVRKLADKRGLFTAGKKDSQGICFVGQVGIREFLSQYVEAKPGDIIEKSSGKKLGKHDGAIFYTLGQRRGLEIGGGLPYYVVSKDMDKNEVYVSADLNDEELWRTELKLEDIHWINEAPSDPSVKVRLRHRATLVDAKLQGPTLQLAWPERAVAVGQSAVIYQNDVCLGGGIIA